MLRNKGNTGRRLSAIAFVFLVHLLMFGIFSVQKPQPNKNIADKTLLYVILRPEKSPEQITPPNRLRLRLQPDISTLVQPPIELEIPRSDIQPTPSAEPGFPKKQDKYQHLFDPRLREKLAQLKHFTKSKTRRVEGIEILDLGDGVCELTSLDDNSFSTGLPSSVRVKCGNNESEQMIENMEKALDDPLNLK